MREGARNNFIAVFIKSCALYFKHSQLKKYYYDKKY